MIRIYEGILTHSQPSAATSAESLPTAVQKAIERAGKVLWQEALTIAAGETETIRQTCLQDAAQARQERCLERAKRIAKRPLCSIGAGRHRRR